MTKGILETLEKTAKMGILETMALLGEGGTWDLRDHRDLLENLAPQPTSLMAVMTRLP